jgi:nitrogen fixation-related uncharacterized protein
MASKARQSVFGGFFGLSLNLVILSFFMWLRSSGGYDANDVASHRLDDEEHSAVYQSDGVEAQLASGVEVIELDYVRIQELSRLFESRHRAYSGWPAPWRRPIRSPS